MGPRVWFDVIGALCGIALLGRAITRIDSHVVRGTVGWAAIAFVGALTSALLGVDAKNFMPDVAAAVLLITTLALTRGKIEVLARPPDRLDHGAPHEESGRHSTGRIWAIAIVGSAAYFGVAFALGSPPM